jgi:hypothetical protein
MGQTELDIDRIGKVGRWWHRDGRHLPPDRDRTVGPNGCTCEGDGGDVDCGTDVGGHGTLIRTVERTLGGGSALVQIARSQAERRDSTTLQTRAQLEADLRSLLAAAFRRDAPDNLTCVLASFA